jgi:hypothetical protein
MRSLKNALFPPAGESRKLEVLAMIFRKKFAGIFILSLSVILAVAAAVAQEAATGEQAPAQQAVSEFEGIVKVGVGRYLYLPSAQGFDIVLQGGDAAALAGKEVRVKGELMKDKASLLVADSLEVKEGGAWRSAFTRSADVVLEDYVDPKDRDAYEVLKITSANNNQEWEGKTKARVFGKLDEGQSPFILLTDEKGKEIGKILVDETTDFTRYYLKKLRLFNKFWFYLNVKDTVDKKVRSKSKELFHADIVLAGLY